MDANSTDKNDGIGLHQIASRWLPYPSGAISIGVVIGDLIFNRSISFSWYAVPVIIAAVHFYYRLARAESAVGQLVGLSEQQARVIYKCRDRITQLESRQTETEAELRAAVQMYNMKALNMVIPSGPEQ